MKKGQALVEFVIILPVFLLLVLGVIDMGNIMISKMNLTNQMSDVIDCYKEGKSIEEINKKLDFNNKYDLKIENDDDYINILLSKKIDIITPGLQLIFESPYQVTVKRSILNE